MATDIRTPRVSVLMPVYNGERYLNEAVRSILAQTFTDFEFLIINDGSTDRSAEMLALFSDPRIRLVENETNIGLIDTLNRGIGLAQGAYIARMDQDDLSLPTRLAEQVAFMDAHPEIGVCGTWIKTLGTGAGYVHEYLTEPEDVRANLLFNTSLAHPSVMIRKAVLDTHQVRYRPEHRHFEDYSLWVELSRFCQLANLPKVLVRYRIHGSSISHVYAAEQKYGASIIRQMQLERLGLTPSDADMRLHNAYTPEQNADIPAFIAAQEQWLMHIQAANTRTNIFAPDSLAKILYTRWRTICGMNARAGLRVWRTYTHSPLVRAYTEASALDSAKLFIKCLVRNR